MLETSVNANLPTKVKMISQTLKNLETGMRVAEQSAGNLDSSRTPQRLHVKHSIKMSDDIVHVRNVKIFNGSGQPR